MVSETDSSVGFLKEKHRDYLRGNSNIEPKSQDERDARRYIREHLKNAILDFAVVYDSDDGHRIEPRDRWKAIGGTRPIDGGHPLPSHLARIINDSDEALKEPDEEIKEGFISVIAFIFSASADAGLDPNDVVKRGIQRYAEAELGDYLEPNVLLQIDTRETQAHSAKQKIKQGKPPKELTDGEVRALLSLAGGPLTPERIQEYLNGNWSWPPEEMEQED